MNREDLLARCPKLAALREAHALDAGNLVEEAIKNPFYIGPRYVDEVVAKALKEFDAALDEIIAVLEKREPSPEPVKVAGLVALNGRVLCTFTGVSVQREPRFEHSDRTGITHAMEPGPTHWRFTGCVFRRETLGSLREAGESRAHVSIAFEFFGEMRPDANTTRVDRWDSDWMKPGAVVRMSFGLKYGGGTVTVEGTTECDTNQQTQGGST